MSPKKLRVSAVALLLGLLAAGQALAAEPLMDVYRTGVRRLRVALPRFQSMGSEEVPEDLRIRLSERLRSTVARSGVLEVIDPKAYLEEPGHVGVLPNEQVYSNWTILGADGLVKGGIGVDGDKWVMELRLYDVGLKRFRKGKRFRGTEEQLNAMVDRFADVMSEELAGAEGIAFSQFVFVSDKTGTKELYQINVDGTNLLRLTANGSINMSPRYTRDGKQLLFTSYIRRGKPNIFFYELLTGRISAFWSRGSLNLGGVESPDGRRVAVVEDDGQGNTQVIVYDKETKEARPLTSGYGISVSPSWSPDGSRIVYVSDRSGTPQIYISPVDGGEQRRVTFQGRYNTSPVWSPKGNEIAFVRREGNEFNLYLIDTDGANEIQLTNGARSNEDPSWSPGGDYLVFSSNRRGNYDLYLLGAGGHFVHRLTDSPANETQPVWSPTGRQIP